LWAGGVETGDVVAAGAEHHQGSVHRVAPRLGVPGLGQAHDVVGRCRLSR
jgi:hypothetical protein